MITKVITLNKIELYYRIKPIQLENAHFAGMFAKPVNSAADAGSGLTVQKTAK